MRLWDADPNSPTFGQTLGDPLFGSAPENENYNFNKVAFSPDGKTLVSTGYARILDMWNVDPASPNFGQLLQKEADWNVVFDNVAFSPDGNFLATAVQGYENHTINIYEPTQLWDVNPTSPNFGKLVIKLEGSHWAHINRLKYHPEGKMLASASQDGMIGLWDVDPDSSTFGQLLGMPLVSGGHDVSGIAFSPDGKYLVSATGEGGKLQIWDVDPGSPTFEQPLGVPLNQDDILAMIVEYSPDGNFIAVGDFFHRIHLWNVNSDAWIEYICERAGRNLTKEEWDLYIHWAGPFDPSYKTCPQWP